MNICCILHEVGGIVICELIFNSSVHIWGPIDNKSMEIIGRQSIYSLSVFHSTVISAGMTINQSSVLVTLSLGGELIIKDLSDSLFTSLQ